MILIATQLIRKRFAAMALYPFILLKDKKLKEDLVLINHERIHLRQQLEMGVVFFYPVYVTEFFIRLIQYKNAQKAYYNISFEREAYSNESDLMYLKKRKWYSFLKYL